MTTLEEITYEAGRHALADQDALVRGIRQRTGTLLAAHALVAPYLGATTIRSNGLEFWGGVGLTSLVAGLVAAAVVLAPWHPRFRARSAFSWSLEPFRGSSRSRYTDGIGTAAASTGSDQTAFHLDWYRGRPRRLIAAPAACAAVSRLA